MRILFIDTVHEILEKRLSEAGHECIDGTTQTESEIYKQLNHIDGIVIRSRFKMDRHFLEKATHLKFIARSGAGMENIDEDYCAAKNIQLFNAPEGNRNAVAEHAIGMLLMLFNHLGKGNTEIRNGIWDREGNRGIEIEGKTIAIIGFGNNGSSFARKLIGFDAHVIAYDKYKSKFSSSTVREVELSEIFDTADIISFHIPQNEETLFMANAAFFNSFKKPIYVINLSRGKIVQTSALVDAMKTNKVLGACLDVLEFEKSSFENFFEQEASTDFRYLLDSPNVILSPHVGGWTKESYFKLSDVLADKILSFFDA